MGPTVLFASEEHDPAPWREALVELIPDLDFRVGPDNIGERADIDVALAWKPAPGELTGLPNLKAILCLGAGVDALLKDTTLPTDVPIARVVDAALTAGMTEYVLYGVLHFHRGFDKMAGFQRERRWTQLPHPLTSACRVGILGLGVLGCDAARALVGLGFDVAGWSRTEKTLDGVASFTGADGLDIFLGRTDILVCLLPLTADTDGILNATTLAKLPVGAYVINAARGGHTVEDDLLAALDSGHIAGAMLDVFETEPLPADHPLWAHPNVVVTPHIASLTAVESAARHLAANIRRVMGGRPLVDAVDRTVGY